ncbi:MAG TPA: hypothetical protein VGI40_04550 [Pirellulaceae bacterium]|jgi:uncharacterized delta-60 repeat protein
MLRFIDITAIATFLALLSPAAPCQDQPNPPFAISLDPTFGNAGVIAEHSIPDATKQGIFLALAIDGRGRPVAAGDSSDHQFSIARYTPDGRPDSIFADNSKASIVIEDQATIDAAGKRQIDSTTDMAIDAQGRIIVVGKAAALDSDRKSDFVVLRFDDRGQLDKSFAGIGYRKYAAHDWPNVATSVATAADGSILVGGYAQAEILRADHLPQIDPLLMRLKNDGAIDEAFSAAANGALRWLVKEEAPAAVSGIALDPQGRTLVSLNLQHGWHSFWAVARLKNNGELDETFGNSGLWSAKLDEHAIREVSCSVAIDSTGRIIVGGCSPDKNLRRLAVARLTSDGKSDSTFGSQKNGAVILDGYGLKADQLVGPRVAIAQGKIAIAGTVEAASRVFGLAVIDDTGKHIAKADPQPFPDSKGDAVNAIAFDSHGRILVVGGSRGPDRKLRFALARYIISAR